MHRTYVDVSNTSLVPCFLLHLSDASDQAHNLLRVYTLCRLLAVEDVTKNLPRQACSIVTDADERSSLFSYHHAVSNTSYVQYLYSLSTIRRRQTTQQLLLLLDVVS